MRRGEGDSDVSLIVGVVLLLLLMTMSSCANTRSASYINAVCNTLPNREVSPDGACVACYKPGRVVMVCDITGN